MNQFFIYFLYHILFLILFHVCLILFNIQFQILNFLILLIRVSNHFLQRIFIIRIYFSFRLNFPCDFHPILQIFYHKRFIIPFFLIRALFPLILYNFSFFSRFNFLIKDLDFFQKRRFQALGLEVLSIQNLHLQNLPYLNFLYLIKDRWQAILYLSIYFILPSFSYLSPA